KGGEGDQRSRPITHAELRRERNREQPLQRIAGEGEGARSVAGRACDVGRTDVAASDVAGVDSAPARQPHPGRNRSAEIGERDQGENGHGQNRSERSRRPRRRSQALPTKMPTIKAAPPIIQTKPSGSGKVVPVGGAGASIRRASKSSTRLRSRVTSAARSRVGLSRSAAGENAIGALGPSDGLAFGCGGS